MKKHNFIFKDSYIFSYILTFIGGYIGAYSYILRGGVFASAQTGNLILLGINIANGNTSNLYRFIFPILIFSCGIVLTEFLKLKFARYQDKWIFFMLTIEIIILILVFFIPLGEMDIYANIFLSLASAIQTQTFKKIGEHIHATTMCTGNIRSLSEFLFFTLLSQNKNDFIKWSLRSFVIISFVFGVATCTITTSIINNLSILFAPLVLSIILFLLKLFK